ncbi:NtaA/DmoA family FMN-dependent monooxygenase [Streptomyces sp. NPDC052042]|uniref:NtaA/DmoA family FMN-dependent monooxygenase n=1 Tax=Streptomyces sp. NPDC052042 TaxID=3365683 RepID=UPI0037D08BD0
MRNLKLGVFENAQTNASGTATWRHPDSRRHHFDTLEYWRDLAAICEDAKLDFLFLADAWGWSEIDGVRPPIATEETLDLPRLDPMVVASALLSTTTNLGLVMTGSVLVEPPYAFARRMATLDQLSGGRIGWNIVTTGTADTAVKAFGMEMVAHDDRYRMAEDFLDLVYKYWEGAWEPDALEKDKDGRFADPAKVHLITHKGPFFRSEGYGNTARSPQGTPVLFQAGASPAGRRVGGRHGECMFVGSGSVEQLAGHTASIREEAVKAGRRADEVKVMSAFSCVVGATTSDAERRYQQILDAQRPEVTVASYAMFTGLDLSSYAPETPMADLSTELSQTQVARFAGKTVGDVLGDWHTHGVGARPVVGTAEEIADEICALAEGADLDGFLLSPTIQPTSTTDFVESVLPILRARGVFRGQYAEGESLRERLTGASDRALPASHPAAQYRH